MPINPEASELFNGFSKLNRHERLARLVEMGALTQDDVKSLISDNKVTPELAEHFIENVIGYFHMPLGVATNLRIDGKDYVIPMAVEETSIIAAASKTAKWLRQQGEIRTRVDGEVLIGQLQIAKVKDFANLAATIEKHKQTLIDTANSDIAKGMHKRGGGIKDITVRQVKRHDTHDMAVIHILIDTCDAMGANIINQVCESLKAPLESLTHEQVNMCILSNLNDTKLTTAEIIIHDIDPELGHNIEEASIFAECDPYRAATNNKGILNAIDAILIATGNDWRAVEASVHAYAARSGQYRSLTQWRMHDNNLHGTLTAPIIVGTVGGVTRLHPTAQLCLKMLGVDKADELSRIVAAVGLVQNLGAIRALTTIGIVQGHMKLHIANLTLSAGAQGDEIPLVKQRLEEILKLRQRISLANAVDVLSQLRQQSH